ncbi:hypothetical protein L7F22_038778 [Adiantum nelumboides]|nr:hypothetical protein [Adiantum nelumboides]
MDYLVSGQEMILLQHSGCSRARHDTAVQLCSSSPGHLRSSSYIHTGFPLRLKISRGNRYGDTLRSMAIKKGEQNRLDAETALKKLVMTSDEGLPWQAMDVDNIEVLRAALVMAHSRMTAAENEKKEVLKAVALAEAKQQEYTATLAQAREAAMQEMQAAKRSFDSEMQSVLEQKRSVDAELATSKKDAINLAVKVDEIASSILQEQAAHLSRAAHLKVAAAETSAAEAAATLEDTIKSAALETANTLMKETRDVIEKSFAEWEAAKDKAYKSELALFQKMQALDDVVLKEASASGLHKADSGLKRQLQAANIEIRRFEAKVKAVVVRAEAAELRASAADEALTRFKEMTDRKAQEHEENAKRALEALKLAGATRLEAAQAAFKADTEALQAALNTVHKAEKSQEQAYARRYQALERSLASSEALAKAWEERACAVEDLLQNSKCGIADTSQVSGGIDAVLSGGRMETLLGNESRKRSLLANGPREENREAVEDKLGAALQGLPPRSLDQKDEWGPQLQLPTPGEVWSIATAKVKEDLYTQKAAEKEAIDEQRRVLEKTLKKELSQKPQQTSESGTGSGREIVFQGFNWESWRKKWYLDLGSKAGDLSSCGITTIWFPPLTHSVSPQGYMPGDLNLILLMVLGDVVLNHRCAQHKGPSGVWNVFGGKLAWGPEAIVRDDPNFQGKGNPSNGDFFHAAPNIDHSQDFVQRDIKEWLRWLRIDIGYDGWRLDFVRGFWGGYVKEYIEATNPAFAIGEYWDSLAYEGGNCSYDQDAHRQRIVNWLNATGGTSSAFDVTSKGILHSALHNEYWRLIDPQGKPPGVMGWWPSRAVTFLENHDTGSTQGHWPFPRDKLMQGYAYILTHPGTPVIFYDQFYDFGLHDPIAELIAVRKRTGVHCRSAVKIYQATNQVYVAQVGTNLVMKLGHMDWNPSKQNNLEGNWQRCLDKGSDYQIWERQ